ncbi:hypothetical protein KUTeg_018107 [Tegillarca granosa]|uniref:F-box domain-containing protein n=1 Tax=Tegillarca granosa TaxID=220873 RepID=A0ABQ9EGV6_TEGGR|nr:hypothetical protein KUTeg_018107 [Tegillarca granosa]
MDKIWEVCEEYGCMVGETPFSVEKSTYSDHNNKAEKRVQVTNEMTAADWQVLLDPLLLHIFGYLSPQEVVRCSQTCLTWYRVALDESLWKQHVYRTWNITGDLAPGTESWYSEYKRLICNVPSECYLELKDHKDEVLDVTFSHDGQHFCTTSKDATVKVWKFHKDGTVSIRFQDNLLLKLGWNLTQYSVFNRTDTLLLVCGVKISGVLPSLDPNPETYTPMGFGAVYNMNNFQLLCVMVMDPPHLFADWFDDHTCVGGYQDGAAGIFKVNSYKIIMTFTISDREEYTEDKAGEVICTFEGDSRRAMNLLVVKVPKTLINNLRSNNNGLTTHTKRVQAEKMSKENGKDKIQSDISLDNLEKLLVFVTGAHHDKLAFYEVKNIANSNNNNNKKSILSDSKRNKTTVSAAAASRKSSRQKVDKPLHIVKQLFINSRPCVVTEDLEYPSLLEDLEIQVVDLNTCTLVQNFKLGGHKAYSDFPAWYICLDASPFYVVSGSEEALAYVWDKHYQCRLKTLQHLEGVVNGVAFNPADPETIVTVGDDLKIMIWCSKNRLKKLSQTCNRGKHLLLMR